MAAIDLFVNLPSTPLSAGVAKTSLQITAPTNQRLKVKEYGLFFDGTVSNASPVEIKIARQSSPGVSLVSATPAPNEQELTESVQSTALTGSLTTQTEPTTGSILETFTCPAFQGQYQYVATPGQEIIVKGGQSLGFICNSPSAINVRGFVKYEE